VEVQVLSSASDVKAKPPPSGRFFFFRHGFVTDT
jgi:hypothetical protein